MPVCPCWPNQARFPVTVLLELLTDHPCRVTAWDCLLWYLIGCVYHETLISTNFDREIAAAIIGSASAVFGQLSKVWNKNISLKNKTNLCIYNAVVISMLLCSREMSHY
jgi:hypothetical protein